MKKIYYRFINRKYISDFRENTTAKYKVCYEKLGEKIMYYLSGFEERYFSEELKQYLTDRMNADIYVFEHAASNRKITEEYYKTHSKSVSDCISAISDIFNREFVEEGVKFGAEWVFTQTNGTKTYCVDRFLNSQSIYDGDELFFNVHTFHAEFVDDDTKALSIDTYNMKDTKCYVHMFKKDDVFCAMDHKGRLDTYHTPIRISVPDAIEKSCVIASENIDINVIKEKKRAISKIITPEFKSLND